MQGFLDTNNCQQPILAGVCSLSSPFQNGGAATRRTGFGLPSSRNNAVWQHNQQQQLLQGHQHTGGAASSGENLQLDFDHRSHSFSSQQSSSQYQQSPNHSMPLDQERLQELLLKQQLQQRLQEQALKQHQEQHMQEQLSVHNSAWLSNNQTASLPPQPVRLRRGSMDVTASTMMMMQSRRRSIDTGAPAMPNKRASIDLSSVPAADRRQSMDLPRLQHNNVSSRYSIDMAAGPNLARNAPAPMNSAVTAAPQGDRRPAGRYSVDIGAGVSWARSSLHSSGSSTAFPARRSPWAVDGTAAVPGPLHPPTIPESPVTTPRTTAASAAKVGFDAGFHAGLHAARQSMTLSSQSEQHQLPSAAAAAADRVASRRASVSSSRPTAQQTWAAPAAEGPDGIIRTSSGGSNSSGNSADSCIYGSNHQQQQLAMQSSLYCSSSGGNSMQGTAPTPARSAAAAATEGQEQQQTAFAALKLVDEELQHLLELKSKFLQAKAAAPVGSAAAAACDAALAKHDAAMQQALSTRASLEVATAGTAATPFLQPGPQDMDVEWADNTDHYDTATGTDTDEEYCRSGGAGPGDTSAQLAAMLRAHSGTLGSGSGTGLRNFSQTAKVAAVALATAAAGGSFSAGQTRHCRRSIDVGSLQFQQQRIRDQSMLRDQQLQAMLLHRRQQWQQQQQYNDTYQQRVQQLKALQVMQADLQAMQGDLAMLNGMPRAVC